MYEGEGDGKKKSKPDRPAAEWARRTRDGPSAGIESMWMRSRRVLQAHSCKRSVTAVFRGFGARAILLAVAVAAAAGDA
jgi:hypothetical protein